MKMPSMKRKITTILDRMKGETKKIEDAAIDKINKDVLFYSYNEDDSMEVYYLKRIINKSNLTISGLKDIFIGKKYSKNFNNLRNSLNNSMIEPTTLNIWCNLLDLERCLPFKLPDDLKDEGEGKDAQT